MKFYGDKGKDGLERYLTNAMLMAVGNGSSSVSVLPINIAEENTKVAVNLSSGLTTLNDDLHMIYGSKREILPLRIR